MECLHSWKFSPADGWAYCRNCPESVRLEAADEIIFNLDLLRYRGRFFESADWFRLLSETTDVEPVVIASDSGVLPCRRDGRGLASLTNFYSIEYAPIGNVRSLLDRVGPSLNLSYLRDGAIEETLRDHGFSTFRYQQYGNWTCEVESNFAGYFGARPSQLRNTVKRRSKALARDHKLELVVLEEPDAAAFTEVYEASWKNTEPYPEFIPALMTAAARLGILRLGLAYIDGEPAAAQLWIVESGRAVIYKLAYKDSFASTSVGTVLSHEMFRYAIDVDGVSLIDYGVGDEPYKRDWMTRRGDVFGLLCFDRRYVSGRLGSAIESVKRFLKSR